MQSPSLSAVSLWSASMTPSPFRSGAESAAASTPSSKPSPSVSALLGLVLSSRSRALVRPSPSRSAVFAWQ